MDDDTYHILSEMQLPQVHLIALTEFERDDKLLLQAKANRSLIEYYFTCTPSLPIYILNHIPEVDLITYLDADLYFFSSIEPIYRELGEKSVLIIGHRFPPALKNLEIFGIYNVGLLSFRRDVNGLKCLHWWRDRCLEWCYDRVEDGRFADQRYLDDWPERFSGVTVLHHKGAGLAPWNIMNYNYSSKEDGFFLDEHPLVVYHFHGLKQINRWLYDANIMTYKARLPELVKESLYYPYITELYHLKRDLQIFAKFDSDQVQPIRARVDTNASAWGKIISSINSGINRLKKKVIYNDLILLNQEEGF